jgi:chromosome segregation ATPase
VEKLAATERELAALQTERQQQTARLAEAQRRLTEAEQKLAADVAAKATGPQDGVENARLKAELAAAQTRLDDAMGLLVAARRETEEQRVEAQAIQGQGAVASRRLQLQLTEATRALEEIRGEKSRLENQLAAARQSQDQSAGAEMRDLVADLAAARARLAESIQAGETAERSRRAQEADNTQLLAQVETLRREVAALQKRPALPADGGPEAARLRTELGAARDTIARLEREQQRLAGEVAAALQARQVAEQAGAGLQAQVGQLRTEIERLGREKQELAAALGQARSADQDEKLSAQLDAATRALESREQTITKLGAQIESLNEDLEVARQSAAAALAAQASAVRALPDAGAMQMEMQTLQGQVRSLEAQLQSDQKNAALEIARLADQLQQARETNRALAEANRSLLNSRTAEEALTTGEAEQLNARVRELTAATERVTRERNELRAQVEGISARLADNERLLAQSKQAGDAARSQAQSAQAELAALQGKLSEADHVTDRQGATVAELTGLNDRLTREKSAMETQLAQLQGQADRAQKDLAELRDRLAASERLGGIQQANADELAGANEQLQAQVKTLTDQVATLRAETSRLGEQGEIAAASRREIAELTAVNQKLTDELAVLRGDSSRLVQAEQARQEAEARLASLGTVSAQLATAQRDITALRAENARLNETMQSLERDRTGRITALQQENAAISARLRQAQGTLDQIASAARLINSGTGGTVTPVRPLGGEPAPQAAAPQARTHIVVDGDSLSRISLRYYGTPNRWQEIYDANRDSLAGANALRPGQALRIP